MSLVQSVERTFEVLEAVATRPAGISELARRVDLPASTVARLLRTLEKIRMVERDAGGLFRLGPKAFALTSTATEPDPVAKIDEAYLAGLSSRLGEVAGFSVRAGDDVLYMAQAASHHEIQVRDWTGERVPLHVVSSGIVFLAHASDYDVERYLSRDLKRFNDQTVCDPQAIRARLEQVRQVGYAWTKGEYHGGINSIAAPIWGHGGALLGALHCHGPSFRFPAPGAEEGLAASLTHAAAQISNVADRPDDLVTTAH